MLYTIASADWVPGRPLPAGSTRPGLFRWRSEAEAVAAGRPLLAVALRYDPSRGAVVPAGPVARATAGPWAAPAIVGARGDVSVLALIPGSLVREVGQAELRAHPGRLSAVPRFHLATSLATRRRADRPAPRPLNRYPTGGQSAA